MLIILTEVKALFLNGGQYAHPSTCISRISTEKLIQKVSNYFRGTLPRKHPEKLTSSGVRSSSDLLPHKWIWLYKSKNLHADRIGCFSLTETNLVLSSCRRIISEPHSLPGLLPDCAGFWELLLSNSSCLFWLLLPSCFFSTSKIWVCSLSKFLQSTKHLLVPLPFPVTPWHYTESLFWLGGMCLLNQFPGKKS